MVIFQNTVQRYEDFLDCANKNAKLCDFIRTRRSVSSLCG